MEKHPDEQLSPREHEAASDIFLAPGGGGMMVWVRRDESLPRSAVRLRGTDMPVEEAVMLLACLRRSCRDLEASMARNMGMPVDILRDMIGIATPVLDKHVSSRFIETPTKKDKTT